MTRINASIQPGALCDQHLMAEYRELPRVIALAKNWAITKEPKELPKKFTLGTGHVLFFYDKMFFLHIRWINIKHELERRLYKLDDQLCMDIHLSFQDCAFKKIYGLYNPTAECNLLLCERIKERLSEMSKITYYGKTITAKEAFEKISLQGIYKN